MFSEINYRIYFILPLFLILMLGSVPAHLSDMRFIKFSQDLPLSNSHITCIFQDSRSFIWIGTEDGLHMFDGYDLTLFRHDPADSNSISDNMITAITEDIIADSTGKKYLWIGTGMNGLNRFDPISEKWQRYAHNPNDDKSLTNDFIFSLLIDRQNTLWIGTRRGLSKLDRINQNFTNFIKSTTESSPSNNFILSICESIIEENVIWMGTLGAINRMDTKENVFTKFEINDVPGILCSDAAGNLWIGGQNGGLYQFDLQGYRFDRITHDIDPPYSQFGNFVRDLQITSGGDIYVGSDAGLYFLDSGSCIKFNAKLYITDPFDEYSIGDNIITTIFLDNSNILWIGAMRGLFRLNLKAKKFRHIRNEPDNPNSLSHDHVRAIYEDSQGIVWISAWDNGLNGYDRARNRWKLYEEDPADSTSLIRNKIMDIYQTRDGDIWLGTVNGLDRFDIKSDQFTHYQKQTGNPKSLIINNVSALFEDSRGIFWLGCIAGIMEKFDRDRSVFEHFYNIWQDPHSFPACRFVFDIFEDDKGTLWFATEGGGVAALRPENLSKMSFDRYPSVDGDSTTIGHNTVHTIFQDYQNTLWFGTRGGLSKLVGDSKGNMGFKTYTMQDGLPNDVIYGILEDNQHNLWLSTNSGLSKFDKTRSLFRNYTHSDGLQSDQFSLNSAYKSKSGEFLFGGIGGISIFYPDSIADDNSVPPVYITDVQIFNNSLKVATGSPLKQNILFTRCIELKYRQSVITLKFAALEFALPAKIIYKYMLQGVDLDWITTASNNRQVTYTNLSPGRYTFMVKSGNADGLWNEEFTALELIILPPWWRTNLAYFLYMVTGIIFVIMIWRIQVNRIETRHKIEIEHLESEKLKEIDSLKSRFFANISHEFRTPLTLIEGPVKQMLQGDFQGNIKEGYGLILKNTRRLLNLINQLLDLSKIEAKRLKLLAARLNIIPLLCGLVQSFESLARRRNIEYVFNRPETAIELFIDRDKFEKIIINLLSNAFKFTPEGGTVKVIVGACEKEHPPQSPLDRGETDYSPLEKGDKGGCIRISITNTGSYLTPEQTEHVFDRFYQVNESEINHIEGSGIGLSLVKELVELHHGNIDVQSDPDSGTTFTLLLPMGKDHLTPEEIIDTHAPVSGKIPENTEVSEESESAVLKSPAGRRILIVEDNKDVRVYVAGLICSDYSILEAENGKQGLEIARAKNPDLIISDVMMPGMDGFEFCRLLKEDLEISHIPVIMLTARADLDDKLAGLELGADDYIAKPFEPKELRLRIRNVLKQRERLRIRFSDEFSIKSHEVTVTSVDEKFLQKLMDTIKNEMQRPEFTIEEMADKMYMSRATLARKIKALTDLSPGTFLRVLRMKTARQLLHKGFGNITEVAYEVGIHSLSHFTHLYVKHFGLRPSDDLKSATT